MPKPKPLDDDDYKPTEPHSLYFASLFLKEIAIKQEDFDHIRMQSWCRDTIDDLLALVLTSSIMENYQEDMPESLLKSFRGLCNTVKYLYDFNHVRFDGENYWFAPDKKILAQLKKERRR